MLPTSAAWCLRRSLAETFNWWLCWKSCRGRTQSPLGCWTHEDRSSWYPKVNNPNTKLAAMVFKTKLNRMENCYPSKTLPVSSAPKIPAKPEDPLLTPARPAHKMPGASAAAPAERSTLVQTGKPTRLQSKTLMGPWLWVRIPNYKLLLLMLNHVKPYKHM